MPDDPYYPPSGEKLGKIQFSLKYDLLESTLSLRIIRAVDLPAKDFSGTSDPYVKVLLLPDKKNKLTTNIKRKNLNPRWNEMFAFEGKYKQVCSFPLTTNDGILCTYTYTRQMLVHVHVPHSLAHD